MVEELDEDTKNDLSEGYCYEEGGEQDCPDLEDEITYHGGTYGPQEDDKIIREEDADCEGQEGECFLHLLSCLAENVSLLAGNVSLVSRRNKNCLQCLHHSLPGWQ